MFDKRRTAQSSSRFRLWSHSSLGGRRDDHANSGDIVRRYVHLPLHPTGPHIRSHDLHSGGADTGKTALRTFLLAMMCFPEAQRAAQEELDRVLGGKRLPDYQDVDDPHTLPYVRGIILECLRYDLPFRLKSETCLFCSPSLGCWNFFWPDFWKKKFDMNFRFGIM